MKLIFLVGILCQFLLGSAYAQAPNDFDGDGLSDFTYVLSATNLTWKTDNSSDSGGLDKVFGLAGDFPILAHWEGGDAPNFAVVRPQTGGKALIWKVLLDSGLISQKSFGQVGDVVLSGGDFNGDGITDAAVVRVNKGTLLWTIKFNMFAESGKTKKIRFGANGDRSFFINPDGEQEWIGVFGVDSKNKVHCTIKNVITGKTRKIKHISRSLAKGTRPRPFPIRQGDGTDAIGFVTQDTSDTTLWTYLLDGALHDRVTFSGLGSHAVGEYLGDQAGQEVLIQTSSELSIYNPFSRALSSRAVLAGSPLGEINVGPVGATVSAPTLTPTPSPSPVIG